MLEKLVFWKKQDDGGLPPLDMPGTDVPPLEPFRPMNHPLAEPPPFTPSTPSAPFSQSPNMQDKDLQLISAKLDTIKAQLENLNQRLARIERIAEASESAQEQAAHSRW